MSSPWETEHNICNHLRIRRDGIVGALYTLAASVCTEERGAVSLKERPKTKAVGIGEDTLLFLPLRSTCVHLRRSKWKQKILLYLDPGVLTAGRAKNGAQGGRQPLWEDEEDLGAAV
jgi:hypothetical protein